MKSQLFGMILQRNTIRFNKSHRCRLSLTLWLFLQDRRLLPVETVADLGGGSGRYLPPLVQNSQAYTIIDISAQMLQYAQQEAKQHVPDQQIAYQQQSVADFMAQTPQKKL